VNRDWWRAFYAEYLAVPVAYGLLAAGVFSIMGFFMTWAGFRGKYRPWGDAIPVTDALTRVPEMAALAFIVTFILFALTRWRP
jgi:uncharacterized oligopeptide transporter (OPT) family protein